eukprot:gene2263-2565_t
MYNCDSSYSGIRDIVCESYPIGECFVTKKLPNTCHEEKTLPFGIRITLDSHRDSYCDRCNQNTNQVTCDIDNANDGSLSTKTSPFVVFNIVSVLIVMLMVKMKYIIFATITLIVAISNAVSVVVPPSAAASTTTISEQVYRDAFISWMNTYDRSYATEEFSSKYQTFKSNYDYVQQWNSKGDSKTLLGLTKFADLTNQEFRNLYTMSNPITTTTTPSLFQQDTPITATTFDWRTKGAVTPVSNLGQCPSAYASSATGGMEGAHQIQTGNLVALSQQQIIDCSDSFGNKGCTYGSPTNSYGYVIHQGGIDSSASYPSKGGASKCKYSSANSVASFSAYINVTSGSESSLAIALNQNPVSVCIDASQMSFQLYSGGVYYEPACSSTVLDLCLLLVGYGTQSAESYWIVRNDFGTNWGINGYIYMSKDPSAVKELVENSLDAKATKIEVRLKDYGEESIEVIDNGLGIEPANFVALTIKYATSKLSSFEDLSTVETLGFRGEALSSLCALADVSVSTRTASQPTATVLRYNADGVIQSQTSMAREVGTTVTLTNIFHRTPVRRQELHRNLKREFAKLQTLLHAYALVSTNVRLSCFNAPKGGTRTCLFSTTGSPSLRDNITAVFGAKQSSGMEEFEASDATFTVRGLVSRIGSRSGAGASIGGGDSLTAAVSSSAASVRSTGDRQFIFLNGRPIDLGALTKIVNALYSTHAKKGTYPALILVITAPPDSYDVNVTPDKRKVFLQNERDLLALVRDKLNSIWEAAQSTFDNNNNNNNSTAIITDQDFLLGTGGDTTNFHQRNAKTNDITVKTSIDVISSLFKARNASVGTIGRAKSDGTTDAVQELTRMFKKEYFTEMQVIGQFNVGFIVARLANDLFIIDQHAADEKYNYETLQKTVVLHSQPLIKPMAVSVTAEEELIIIDNLPLFSKNGFEFDIDPDAPPKYKVKITALPHSKNTVFGVAVEDAGATLIFLPKYSPELNPIEPLFGFIKAYISRNRIDTNSILLEIDRALETLELETIHRWYRASLGSWLPKI